MIRYTFAFGPSIQLNEARVRYQSKSSPLRLYFLLFAGTAALFHPSDQLGSAPFMVQAGFWISGLLLFIYTHRILLIASIRLALARRWNTLYVHGPLELTLFLVALYLYGYAQYFGIPTADRGDLAQFYLFCITLFELGAFCYVAYADRAIYPEIYEQKAPEPGAESGTPTEAQRLQREIFLRGSTLPVHQVEVIVAQGNGVEATGLGRAEFIARPFGQVVAELPVDLGFQIHRSLWVARDLAVNFVTDERKHLVVLPDGRRIPVARSRQRDYRSWLALVTQSRT
ncbi:MAG: LytTR family DNA-binding domain-containing protein [Rhodobacteraceae bacterium]|nr:LytTR family DNA-binding domain-containing protein [Paracoccaceae bacterium]